MCVATDYVEYCKNCNSTLDEYRELDNCPQNCLPGWVEDGNKGGPPTPLYLICVDCIEPVKKEIAELDQSIKGLQASLKEWEEELETASGGDDYAYIQRCKEEIESVKGLLDENDLRKADLEISLEASE